MGTVAELLEELQCMLGEGKIGLDDKVALHGCDCVGAWSGEVKLIEEPVRVVELVRGLRIPELE